MIPLDKAGNAMPVVMLDTAKAIEIDGTLAHAESGKLAQGMYRLSVVTSVADGGVRIEIGSAPTAAAGDGSYLSHGATEYLFIKADDIISVVNGLLNVTPIS